MSQRLTWLVMCAWLALVASSLAWNWRYVDDSVMGLARSEARSHLDKDLLYRRWGAIQGGVYVPPTAATPPNPYLAHLPDRDVVTTTGKQLTLINPAYMTRQVHELANQQFGVKGHLTSLNPLRPENAPDAWEREALHSFAAGAKTAHALQTLGDASYLRFMRPMVTEPPCLKCHASQGYKVGDIRGGISVSVPFAPYLRIADEQRQTLLLGHGGIAIFGLVGLWAAGRRLQRSETALQASLNAAVHLAEKESLLLSSLGEGVYGIDRAGLCMFINPAALTMLGFQEAEVIGQNQHALFHYRHPDGTLYPHQECPVYRTLHDGVRREAEDAFVHKDGHTIPVRLTVTPMHQNDAIVGSIAVFQDITAERQTHAALIASEERFRTIADYTYDWEYWQGPAQEIRYISPSCERITGYAPATFIADPELLNRIVHPDDRPLMETHLLDILSQDTCAVEFRIITPEGETRWIAHGCRAVYGHDGRYLGRRASNRDITANKQAELEYKTIVQTAQDGFLVVAADTAFLDTNEAYCRMLGYSREELLRLKVADIEAQESPEEVQRHTEEVHRHGHAQFETRHRCKDGQILDVEITTNRLDIHGGVLIAFVRDISERKRATAELERYRLHLEDLVTDRTAELEVARDQAEAANRAKSTFLANMSHELRTPMNAIMGFTDILLYRQPTPEQQDKLKKISSASQRLLKLINDILDYTQIEAGRVALQPVVFDPRAWLEALLAQAREAAQAKGLNLQLDLDTLPERLVGDTVLLGQALAIYLENAIKFTEQGHITLRAEAHQEIEGDLLVRFAVEDTGIGVPMDKRAQVFATFEQGDGSSTRKYGGTGLGLALCKRLAELMGGQVGVEGRSAGGSVFWLTARLGKVVKQD